MWTNQAANQDTPRQSVNLLHGQTVSLLLERGAVLVVCAGRVVVTRRIWLDNAMLTLTTPCARGGVYQAPIAEQVDIHSEHGAALWVASARAPALAHAALKLWNGWSLASIFTAMAVRFALKPSKTAF